VTPAHPTVEPPALAPTQLLRPPTRYTPIDVTTLADGQQLVLPVHRLEGATPGPTLGLIALLHGDETLPHEIVRRVLADVPARELRGTILAVPVAYGPALEALTRNSPLDMLDLNRSFPGDPGGWVTEQLAHVLAERVLTEVDALLDLHSGGLFPTVDYVYVAEGERELELAVALGCEHVYVAREPHPGGLAGLARRRGIPAAMLEIGGGLVADEALVEKGVAAVARALAHLGMLDGVTPAGVRQVVFDEMAWLRPRVGGMLYPAVGIERLGGPVEAGELLGRVVSPLTFEVLEELRSPFQRGRLVLLRASLSRVHPGDFAYMVGDVASEQEVSG
jgi:predicted deacylase